MSQPALSNPLRLLPAGLLICLLGALPTRDADAKGAGSAATAHVVRAIQELEREVQSAPNDEHRKKALSLLLRARAEILRADSGKPAPRP